MDQSPEQPTPKPQEPPNIQQELRRIKSSLVRTKEMRRLATGHEPSPEERLLASVFTEATSIARSEFQVTPEQEALLNKKIDKVRTILSNTPPRDRMLHAPELRPPGKLAENLVGMKFNDITAQADTVPFDDIPDISDDELEEAMLPETYLTLFTIDQEQGLSHVEIEFNYYGDYLLELDFSSLVHPERVEATFSSGTRPTEEMTPEEYKIVNHYMDRVLIHAEEPNLPQPTA